MSHVLIGINNLSQVIFILVFCRPLCKTALPISTLSLFSFHLRTLFISPFLLYPLPLSGLRDFAAQLPPSRPPRRLPCQTSHRGHRFLAASSLSSWRSRNIRQIACNRSTPSQFIKIPWDFFFIVKMPVSIYID